jgi:hypothetical protein
MTQLPNIFRISNRLGNPKSATVCAKSFTQLSRMWKNGFSKPHFLKHGKYAAVLGTAKEWVTLTIFNTESLQAPDGFFEPGPAERKTVKIRQGQTVDYELLGQLMRQVASV